MLQLPASNAGVKSNYGSCFINTLRQVVMAQNHKIGDVKRHMMKMMDEILDEEQDRPTMVYSNPFAGYFNLDGAFANSRTLNSAPASVNMDKSPGAMPSTSSAILQHIDITNCDNMPQVHKNEPDLFDETEDFMSTSTPTPPSLSSAFNSTGTRAKTFEEITQPAVVTHYVCMLCTNADSTFFAADELKAHMLHVHTKDNQCSVCAKFDVTGGQLIGHMHKHTLYRHFCAYCARQANLHSLKVHIRTHTGERPYSCQVCGRTFSDGSGHRRHLLTHTGQRPYRCPICGRSVARRDNIKVHLQRHFRPHQVPKEIMKLAVSSKY